MTLKVRQVMRGVRETIIKWTLAAFFPCIYEESARIGINHPQTRAITGLKRRVGFVWLRTQVRVVKVRQEMRMVRKLKGGGYVNCAK